MPLDEFGNHLDRSSWAERTVRVARVIATRPRDEWVEQFASLDACVSPVLTVSEALVYPANRSRALFGNIGGVEQPMPAPRFDRTPAAITGAPRTIDQDGDSIRARVAASEAWPD